MRNTQLERLSKQFVDGVLATLRKAPIEELATLLPSVRQLLSRVEAKKPDQKLRAARDTEDVMGAALDLLRETPEGLRSEQLSRALNVHPARMRLALVELVQHGSVGRVGRARGVRYVFASKPIAQPEAKSLPTDVPESLIAETLARLGAASVPLTAGGLAPVLGEPKDLVRAALEQLVERGEAIRQGAGRYRRVDVARASDAPASGEVPLNLMTGAALASPVTPAPRLRAAADERPAERGVHRLRG